MHLRPTAFPKLSEPINDRGSSFGVDGLWRKVITNRLLSFLPIFFLCALITIMITAPVVAHAAQFEGVQIPDTLEVDGKTLHLNGYGLRKYSILGIHIYIASL
jgi:Chalcone isomerase-like